MTAIDNPDDFAALDPFFRIIEEGLGGLVDGDHFFDLLAADVVFDYVITVPGYPRHVVGRSAVATGAVYAIRYISMITISDRKVARWRDYLDPIAVFEAVGWPPRPIADSP